jgi:hypothetical protein
VCTRSMRRGSSLGVPEGWCSRSFLTMLAAFGVAGLAPSAQAQHDITGPRYEICFPLVSVSWCSDPRNESHPCSDSPATRSPDGPNRRWRRLSSVALALAAEQRAELIVYLRLT